MNTRIVAPSLLLCYKALRKRKVLSESELAHYEQIVKGFNGEKSVEDILLSISDEKQISLFDCLFEVNGTEFQIDCILLTTNTIFLLESKYYYGDYYFDNGKIYSLPTKKEIANPLLQLERTEFLFKKLLEQLKINFEVRSYIIFSNNYFTLYHAPVNQPFVFPPQIYRFLQKITANANSINKSTEQIATLLRSHIKEKSAYEKLPKYTFNELKHNVFCDNCFGSLKRLNRNEFICPQCRTSSLTAEVILAAVAEFHLLFPNQQITTKTIVDWCGNTLSKNTIRKTLHQHLTVNSNGKHTHYTMKNKRKLLQLLTKKIKIR